MLEIGGSNGLDSHLMEMASAACGHSVSSSSSSSALHHTEAVEQAIYCGVTTIRLLSSGNYINRAMVSIRPATENDMSIATLVCQM